ncbi:MAG: hypothetical protein D4R92_00195 [Actinobacteria bacterium]|nr:MAG: hypothetical protein D4R92_00195 [Actinomycetota bacterium]
MTKRLVGLLITLCLLGGFQTQALAGASAGGKCSSTGKIAVVGTARLVCAKVGKAKVWIALDSTVFKAPSITSIIIAPSATSNYYLQGQIINILITFDAGVVVTGVPTIGLDSEMKGRVLYSGGSGTQVLLFSYATKAGDIDSIGFGLKSDSIELGGGSINSLNGTPANLAHTAIARSSTRVLGATAPVATTTTIVKTVTTVAATVTTVAATTTTVASSATPKITSLTFKEPGTKWVTGQAVVFKVVFDQVVVVNTTGGMPYVSVLSDSTQKLTATGVNYTEGSGGTTLLFSYTVISADTESTGLGTNANAIVLNGGTIKSSAGVNADLTSAAIARSSKRLIN